MLLFSKLPSKYTLHFHISDKPERPIILPISDSHITWRSITVRWAVGRRRDQPIRYFTLRFRKGQGAWEIYPKPLSGDDDEVVVWGLESNHLYSFQITATNDAGTSPPSEASPLVRTLRKCKNDIVSCPLKKITCYLMKELAE